MSIYRRKSGRWQAVVDGESTPNGQRKRTVVSTFATRKEAQRAEREALASRDRGIDLAPRTVTLREVVERFLDDVQTRITVQTARRYEQRGRVNVAPSLGSIAIAKVRPAHIAALYAKLSHDPRFRGSPLQPRTVYDTHRFLHRVFAWAEKLGLVERNVVRIVDPPRAGSSTARALTPDEAAAFLAAAKASRWHSFFVVALSTGMRRGELTALRWDAVDVDRGTVIVRFAFGDDRRGGQHLKTTKTGKERTVPLSPIALWALRKQRAQLAADKLAAGVKYADEGYVFANARGGPNKLNASTKAFKKIAGEAKLPGITLHSLRHTAATWALAGGTDVRTTAALLGHQNPTLTLNTYGHVVAGLQEQAVSVIDKTLERAQARWAAGENRRG